MLCLVPRSNDEGATCALSIRRISSADGGLPLEESAYRSPPFSDPHDQEKPKRWLYLYGRSAQKKSQWSGISIDNDIRNIGAWHRHSPKNQSLIWTSSNGERFCGPRPLTQRRTSAGNATRSKSTCVPRVRQWLVISLIIIPLFGRRWLHFPARSPFTPYQPKRVILRCPSGRSSLIAARAHQFEI
jgi:hypothetical protein